mmetsp:Transcript_30962/g.29575  ORF Transcript_30962/g.29575 Transcript_30962/m.29575 type:complete len:535 (-) Transcript_30962:3-1607(-)
MEENGCKHTPTATTDHLISRYSRQMLVPCVGLDGQVLLSQSSVLVIGAGGIGSTVLMYLAGAGVGHIGVLDFDIIETSNLHRQIIHDSASVKTKKCDSAVARMKALNPLIRCSAIDIKLTTDNAIDNFKEFDVIVDATDNFEARYIINDACVLLGKPLVSGSAVGMEGQITVLAPRIGPCYRCLYPKPSLLEGCRSCANAGVLGPVPGLIGCLQAVEAIKVLQSYDVRVNVAEAARRHYQHTSHVSLSRNDTDDEECVDGNRYLSTDNDKGSNSHKLIGSSQIRKSEKNRKDICPLIGKQLLYDAASGEFHNFLLPPRNSLCAVCGDTPKIRSMDDTKENLRQYAEQASQVAPNMALPETNSITIEAYNDLCISGKKHVMIDVRNSIQYNILSFNWYMKKEKGSLQLESQETNKFEKQSILKNAANLSTIKDSVKVCHCPLSELKKTLENNGGINVLQDKLLIFTTDSFSSEQVIQNIVDLMENKNEPLYVICRRGIDSVFATQLLLKNGFNAINIIGGLTAWHDIVDNDFPMY